MDEVFYMLDGEAEFLVGDRREIARKGALVFIPRGTVHAFRVVSNEAHFLNLYTPAGFDRIVTAMGQRTDARTLPPSGWTPPDFPRQRGDEMFAEFGMLRLNVADPFQAQTAVA
jgi:Cupin domain